MSLFRRRLLMAAAQSGGEVVVLPDGYTQVAYIENTSTANIRVDIRPQKGLIVYLSMKFTYPITTRQLFGFDAASGWYVGVRVKNGIALYENDGAYTKKVSPSENSYDNLKYRPSSAADDISEFYVNNNFIGNNVYSLSATNTRGFSVFGASLSGGYDVGFNVKARLRDARFEVNDNIVARLIPCISPTKEVGMYDIVNNRFYGSTTSVPFIVGNHI